MQRINKSLLTISCIILVALISYFIFILPLQRNYYTHHVNIHGIYLLNPIEIENFELIDQNSQAFTKNNLKNHWSLLFFGFTHCNMVCPVTLTVLNQAYQQLEKRLSTKDKPLVVFITIDPERDTIKSLKEYMLQFNPHFLGARTSIEKTNLLKKQFHIIAEKTQSNDQFNHSTEILLINPKAEIQAYFSYPPNQMQLVKDYMAILNNYSAANTTTK